MSLRNKSIFLITLILVIDQSVKFWIKTHMTLGEEFHVLGNWFIIHFTENNGMAFGIEFWGKFGKLFLSLFRMVAIGAIGYFIYKLIKQKASTGLVLGISAIMAGAIGNLIDSAFYGLVFNESYVEPAKFLPIGGGYASFLHGKVVDMLYFPIINTTYPNWIPGFGGQPFVFFSPVFNLADSAITIGVFYLLIFQRKALLEKPETTTEEVV
jgi:signal peptidase II